MLKKKIVSGLVMLLFMCVTISQAVAQQYTENLCTGGTPFFNTEHSVQVAAKAFDGIKTGDVWAGWLSEAGGSGSEFPDWIGYDFGAGNEKVITQYVLYTHEVLIAPKNWTFEGSNDNTNWEVLDTQTDIGSWVLWEPKTFQIPNSASYRYYRINVTASHYHHQVVKIGEFEMMGDLPATISLVPDNTNPVIGDSMCIDVNAANVDAMYSASFDMTYDPTTLQYTGATEGNFLNADSGATFFEASLLNGDPANGIVVVGVSRVSDIGSVSGSGTLATVCFSVIGGAGTDISVGISNGIFEGETPGSTVTITQEPDPVIPVAVSPPTNLTVFDPATLDQLDLSWDTASGAASYQIFRADSSGGSFMQIGTSTGTSFQDSICVITNATYYYKVKAVAPGGDVTDFSNEASGFPAGLTGDLNKDNRVDGRDLTILARAFNTTEGNPDYECRANLDRTGPIDGDDLVLLSGTFGDQI